MKMRVSIDFTECPSCGRTKDEAGNPIKHHAKGMCKMCYIRKLRKGKRKMSTP